MDHRHDEKGDCGPLSFLRDHLEEAMPFANPILRGIDDYILEREMFHAISYMPSKKTSGPDGFT